MIDTQRAAQAQTGEAANEQRYAIVRAEGSVTPFNDTTRMIPVTMGIIGGATVQTVNARELHEFLEVGKDFSTWVKDRIEQYDFEQGRDFEVFTDSGENPQGGRPPKEYAITLDMGKELAMVERTPKGKEARQYFIECERRALAAAPAAPALPNFSDPVAAARAWADQCELRLAVEAQRDEAVRTKALIGSAREATAMATASAATRQVTKLRAQLGEAAEFASIAAVNRAFGLKIDDRKAWRPLKKWCEEHGVKPLDAIDPRWGKIKRWPAGAWLHEYGIHLSDKFGAAGEE